MSALQVAESHALAVPSMARAYVAAEAESWLGTPYHECADVRGVGVDCAMLLVRVYANCGLGDPTFDPRPYPPRFHLHRSEELYEQWLTAAGARRVDDPQMGDIALFRFGRCFSHGAVIVDEQGSLVHAYIGLGVTFTRQGEAPLAGREVRYWSMFDGR